MLRSLFAAGLVGGRRQAGGTRDNLAADAGCHLQRFQAATGHTDVHELLGRRGYIGHEPFPPQHSLLASDWCPGPQLNPINVVFLAIHASLAVTGRCSNLATCGSHCSAGHLLQLGIWTTTTGIIRKFFILLLFESGETRTSQELFEPFTSIDVGSHAAKNCTPTCINHQPRSIDWLPSHRRPSPSRMMAIWPWLPRPTS